MRKSLLQPTSRNTASGGRNTAAMNLRSAVVSRRLWVYGKLGRSCLPLPLLPLLLLH